MNPSSEFLDERRMLRVDTEVGCFPCLISREDVISFIPTERLLPNRDNELTHENGEEQQCSGKHRVFAHVTPNIANNSRRI
jgi:hypothetical protein